MKVVRCTPDQLPGLIAEDMKRLDGRVKLLGLGGTAVDGAHIIANNVPIAFADLRKSVHADLTRALEGITRTVVSAPHAAAVEKGSRPHWAPLAPLVAWVKLRGMQGIDKKGRIRNPNRKAWGKTTAGHAFHVATQIKAMEQAGAVPIEAPVEIARRIQAAIAAHGTKPDWYARDSLKVIRAALDRRMKKAVHGT